MKKNYAVFQAATAPLIKAPMAQPQQTFPTAAAFTTAAARQLGAAAGLSQVQAQTQQLTTSYATAAALGGFVIDDLFMF